MFFFYFFIFLVTLDTLRLIHKHRHRHRTWRSHNSDATTHHTFQIVLERVPEGLKRLAFSFLFLLLTWKWLGQPGRNVVPCNADCWCGEKKVLASFIGVFGQYTTFHLWSAEFGIKNKLARVCQRSIGCTDSKKWTTTFCKDCSCVDRVVEPYFCWSKALGKNIKNDTSFVRMRSGDHLGDANLSKKGISRRRT